MTVAVVEQYWSGVLRRLQAEVEVFNELICHAGEKGRANELTLSSMVSRLVPQKYAVGTGLLIDSFDAASSQMDLIIFNRTDEPALLAQSSHLLFPVENVRLCVEVKTTIDKEEIEDAARKCASVRALRPVERPHPFFALVGYSSDLRVETTAKHLREIGRDIDLVCILRDGIVAGSSALFSAPQAASEPNYMVGWATLPAEVQDVALSGQSEAEQRRPRTAVLYGGNLYPVVRRGPRDRTVTDPARALLLFCDAMLRLLGTRDDVAPTLSHYITDDARSLRLLDEAVET